MTAVEQPTTSTDETNTVNTDQEQPSLNNNAESDASSKTTDVPLLKGMVATGVSNVYLLLSEDGTPMGYFTPIIKADGTIEWLEVNEDGTPLGALKTNPKTGDRDYPIRQITFISFFAIAVFLFFRLKRYINKV